MIWSPDKYLRALDFATNAHDYQKIPGTENPYVIHVVKVAMEVMSLYSSHPAYNFDLAVQCALLHDTIEDTSVSYNDIATGFGIDVADGVLALTKDKNLPTKDQMQDSLDRILQQPFEIAMVKLADRITNLSKPPSFWSNEKKSTYLKEAGLILGELGPVSLRLRTRLAERIKSYGQFID